MTKATSASRLFSRSRPRARARSHTVTAAIALAAVTLPVGGPHGRGAAQALAQAPKGNAGGATVTALEPPLSLTASDGSGLELVSLSAQAVVEDPLAFTELHLVFRNPENRTREGRFRITLPSGATVSRFAMRVGDRWQEGEVVEQQAARVAYEDFLHRRQDPALLETEAGNEFSARVFPIPAAATKELIVSYSQELPRTAEPYRLPLRGLPRLGSLHIRALIGKTPVGGGAPATSLGGRRGRHEVVEVDRRDFQPDHDFEVVPAGTAAPAPARLGLREGNLVVARIVPVADSDRRDPVGSLLVLVDTSASRALGLGEELGAWESLVAQVRKNGGGPDSDPMLTVAAFDQDVAPIFSGPASALGDQARRKIAERRALGASDLDRALRWAADTLRPVAQRRTRVLLVTDGVATAGETSAAALRQRVKALAGVGVERLDVLAVGGIREDALLAHLATAGLARDGVVLDAAQPAAALAHRLMRATRSGLKLEVDGAGWIWPSVINGVQPGDEMLVYADLPADKPLRVKVAGQPLALAGALASVDRPLLERAWVKARIARLLDLHDRNEGAGAGAGAGVDPDRRDVFKKQAIELSIQNRVLCPYTSLLVLESEQDYARFGIERRALADVLTIDAGGIRLVHRIDTAPATAIAVADTSRPSKDAEGLMEDAAAVRPVRRAEAPAKASEAGERGRMGAVDSWRPRALANLRADDAERAATAGAARTAAPVMQPPPAAPPARMAAAGAAVERDRGDPDPGVRSKRAASRSDLINGELRGRDAPAPRETERAPIGVATGRVARPLSTRGSSPQQIAAPASESESALGLSASVPALQGRLGEIVALIGRHDLAAALARARAWRDRDAGDVLALVALGECGEAAGDLTLAARAYGSIIDLFPGRADMRRFAGERLERVRGASALALAVDTYRKAVEQRPDHPASHRLLAFALLKQGRAHEAFDAIAAGASRHYPDGRFAGVDRILREDLGLLAQAWIRAEPARTAEIRGRLERAHGIAETAPSVRFVLNWETDANDVDFHIRDGKGGHAYFGARQLASGGELYADVTTGYGPECFTIRASSDGPSGARAYPYQLQAHYYSRGPMGYGMGKLQIIEHDGQGHLRFDERPFVIMQDGAFIDLGTVKGPGVPLAERGGTARTR
jgi:Vault protein inter-alpha-trypsin domain/von Willebrand factor type A domain